jgi:hypothetical protein
VLAAVFDRYAGLIRIGIDEIAYKKRRRYLTVVVDHDTGRLVWAGLGRESATLEEFFDQPGPERCKRITLISDAARYVAKAVTVRLPHAIQCADPPHRSPMQNPAPHAQPAPIPTPPGPDRPTSPQPDAETRTTRRLPHQTPTQPHRPTPPAPAQRPQRNRGRGLSASGRHSPHQGSG